MQGSANGILTLLPAFAPCSYFSGAVPNPLVVGGSSTQHPMLALAIC